MSHVDLNDAQNISRLNFVENTIGAFGKWQFHICVILFVWRIPETWAWDVDTFLTYSDSFECVDSSIPMCDPKCPAYNYTGSLFPHTIITEWNLVCDRAHLVALSTAIYRLGTIGGCFVYGTISDKYDLSAYGRDSF